MRRLFGTVAAGAAIAALLMGPARAQPEMTARGAKFGFNFAKMKNGSESDSRFTFAGGGFMTFEINEQISFQPEILLSMKGGEDTIGGAKYEAKLSYLECQSLVKFTAPSAAEVKPIAFGGLSVGLNLTDEVSGPGNPPDLDANFLELALVVGGGLEFPAGEGTMAVDLRLSMGLTDVPDVGSSKNSVLSIMAGYAF